MNKESGFTLIEMLVATVVLSVGLLGLAGLQAASIKNNISAYNRSQATQLAYDMADRMRANRGESISSATENVISTSTYLTMAAAAAAEQADCLTTTGCTPAQMAENDLYEWNKAITDTLADGVGNIDADAATAVFTISINWDDNHDGAVDNSDPNFQVSFQL